MQSFLDQVAEKVLKDHHSRLHNLCLVTPNRRAGLFLKKSFATLTTKAMWAPDILSMEDFIEKITGLSIQEPVALLLDFYQVYQQTEKEKAEPLEEFLKWAPMLLKDFNDIDDYLSEPGKLFGSVTDVKRIESWNPDGKPLTAFQQKYISFFTKFQQWHQELSSYLLEKKTAWQGLAYRVAVQQLTASPTLTLPWQMVVFTGFNALSESGETIMRTLVKQSRAEVLWDADKYYLSNPNHEAGNFLRKYRRHWDLKEFSFEGDHFSINKKDIKVYGVAKNVNQAKLASNILKTFSPDSFPNHQTAVVLASEDLLLPMLNSLPDDIGKVNVTMGYPVRKTNIYSLFDTIFRLHVTTQRMRSAAGGLKSAFYFKDLARLFRHPALAIMAEEETGHYSTEEFIRKIYESKKMFLSVENLAGFWGDKEIFTGIFALFLEGYASEPQKILPALNSLIIRLDTAYRKKSEHEQVALENAPWFTDYEALLSMGMVIRKLMQYHEEQRIEPELRLLYMLFQAMARESRLVLSGEPLAGLQIMGMLETRNLDFKNVIILSANEDILPAGRSNSSLIPFDVRAHFGLPVYKEKDAVYAYHFYRLLQRAENIYIIYNTQAQDMGSSEKSRYITQLQMEMPRWNPNISITEQIIPLPPAEQEPSPDIAISKTPEIMAALETINAKGFSPTTLNHFIKCSLFFYFRHIAGIEETIAPEETIQANTLGTVIHEVLEQLYNDEKLQGQVLQIHHIENMLKKADHAITEKFAQVYKGGDVTSGKNLLLAKVATRYVKNFLRMEKEMIEELQSRNTFITYLRAEEEMTAQIETIVQGTKYTIKLRGFADRIDKVDNTIRVIDYKTGKVDERSELRVNEWEDMLENSKLGKSFQLMMYALLYSRNYESPENLTPGIISFRSLAKGLMTLSYPGGSGTIGESAIESFEEILQQLFQNIFDPEQPFHRTEKEENCINCEFRVVCNR